MKCGIIYNVKARLDILLTQRKIVDSRSQAESYIKLGKVFVDGVKISKFLWFQILGVFFFFFFFF